MGVDVSSVAGYGIRITDKEVELIKEKGLEDLFEVYGSAYTGDTERVWLIESKDYRDLPQAVVKSLLELNEMLGSNYNPTDVEWIEELYWW